MKKIIVENLKATYVNKKIETKALDNVSFDVDAGEMLVIIGQSGCGKSTLLKCLAGLMDYQGKIELNGIDSAMLSVKNRNMSYVSQSFTTYSYLNVYNNIAMPLKANKIDYDEIERRINQVAKDLSIDYLLTRKPKYLSLGQCQKVALARAIVKRPDIYLFDEPFANLDNLSRVENRKLIKDIKNKYGATMIFVTHDINDAIYLADKVIVLENGKIVQQGSVDDIINRPVNELVYELVHSNKEYE